MAARLTNKAFLRAIFGKDWGLAHVTSFFGDTKSAARGAWVGRRASSLVRAMRPQENTYFCISLFADDKNGRARRRRELFRACHVIVVDDVGSKVLGADVLERLGAPTYRLETSPGNEQWGYLLTTPERDASRVEALLNGLVAFGIAQDGKDPGMKGVPRYVRLPVGTNGKAAYGLGGFRHRLLEWEPSRRFSMEQLAAGYGIDLSARPTAKPVTHRPAATGNDPVLKALNTLGLVQSTSDDGATVHIICPFVAEHSHGDATGTAYFLGGGFNCFHGHCYGRRRSDFIAELTGMLADTGDRTFFPRHDFVDVDQEADTALFALIRRGGVPSDDELAAIASILAGVSDLSARVDEMEAFAPADAPWDSLAWQTRIKAVAADQDRWGRANVENVATEAAPVGQVLAPAGSAPAQMTPAELEIWMRGDLA